jgi:predicted amidohydrolase/GNAT superfamily N-acetyltransferase
VDNQELHLTLRNITEEDYPQLKALMDRVYPDLGGAWSRRTVARLIADFPEGQICIIDKDQMVGVALTLRVRYSRFSNPHTYDDLINHKEEAINDPDGDVLYGLDVFIDPQYQGYRLGRRLYDARKELCRNDNYRGILAGGRIPRYHEYMGELTPAQYIEKVARREIYDPILTFQLANDFQVKRLLRKYLPQDEKSAGFATLLEWHNILYDPAEKVVLGRKSVVRVGVVQSQMRMVNSIEELLAQVEYFVDAVSDYSSDFVLFPEFFTAPLMGLKKSKNSHESIRFLAGFTERFRHEMSHMAVSYNINIITGSMPLLEDDRIYNVSYLCRRDGSVDEQRKIHITPQERHHWVVEGGSELRCFDTDAGRIGILICYDVEFPELSRLLALQKMDILFVPFWTDTKNAYLRVRHCAQARAIENECYVAIAGSIGNLPSVDNLDVQYAQSAVFSPSDFAFPQDAVMAETTPNTEMIIFSDLDLDKLRVLRNEGAVNNLKDRREDLYVLRPQRDFFKH